MAAFESADYPKFDAEPVDRLSPYSRAIVSRAAVSTSPIEPSPIELVELDVY